MAGLAASIAHPPKVTEALAQALAARGSEVALRKTGDTTLIVRAALPMVHVVDGCYVAVSGLADLPLLVEAYRRQGPVGLLGGAEAYALILKDPARDGVLLARNGDGPSLYYARAGGGSVVASEPEALLAAGVPARPNAAVISAFLSAGECDTTADTFFAGIRRVQPGRVLTLHASVVDHTRADRAAARPVSPRLALRSATSGNIGVRLGSGPVGAAILGAALVRPDLPVYSNRFPGLSGRAAEHASTLLGPLPDHAVRHRALPFFPDSLDLDGFLDDVGEPLPDLDSYLLWATAKETAGEVDALIDAAPPAPHLGRLSDRVSSRYGVELRFPLSHTLEPGSDTSEWTAIARQTLRAAATGAGLGDVPLHPPMAEIVSRIGPALATSLLHDQPKGDDRAAIEALAALVAGEEADAGLLFRRYMLAHWLRWHFPAHDAHESVPRKRPAATIAVDDRVWRRTPVATELLHPGDPLAEKLAWYAAETLAARTSAKPQPWYLLVAAKPVAVTQGRLRPVWGIRPGFSARLASALSTRPAWLEQTAVSHSGGVRTVAAALAGRLRLYAVAGRITSEAMAGIRAPRPDAAGPATYSVVSAPRDGDDLAEQIIATLAKVLGDEELAAFAGCAILSSNDDGSRLYGFAGTGDPATAKALAKGNPFGQADSREPIVVAVAEPPSKSGARPSWKGKRRPVR